MKKKLLFVFLSLAILTAMTASTLAVYTKTLSDTEQIRAKQFAFTTESDFTGNHIKINLAPNESTEVKFSFANVDDNGLIAEVPLQFDVTIDYADAFDKMPGLTASLYDDEEKVGVYSDGHIQYTTQSSADVPFKRNYTVVLTWADDGNSNIEQTTAGSDKVSLINGITLTVVASQVIP